jgi:hypothetical protein
VRPAGRVNLVTVDTLGWQDGCPRGGVLQVDVAGVTARLAFEAEGLAEVDLDGDEVPEVTFSTLPVGSSERADEPCDPLQ